MNDDYEKLLYSKTDKPVKPAPREAAIPSWIVAVLVLFGFGIVLGLIGFGVSMDLLGKLHKALHSHTDTENGAELLVSDVFFRAEESKEGFVKPFWKAVNGSGNAEDCFTFTPFGGENVCELISGERDPHGGMDIVSWKANGNGLTIPAHEHQCADEVWQIVNGSCTLWSDLVTDFTENLAEFPSLPPADDDDAYIDWLGIPWRDKITVFGPGTLSFPRGTPFTWTCELDTFLWTIFTPGGNGGIIRAFATRIFIPPPLHYPITQSTVRQVENRYCTRFVQAALDQAGVPFGFDSRPNAYPWARKQNYDPSIPTD